MSTWEYNQMEYLGIPYSISTAMLENLFDKMVVELIETIDMSGTFFTKRFKLSCANRLLHLLTH